MFTGLIESLGRIKSIEKTHKGAKFKICAKFENSPKIGDSVSINGACQTIVKINEDCFEVEAMNETLKLTNFGNLKIGDIVNLELAMQASGRFGGHFVSGHIDGVAKLLSIKQDGFSNVLKFEYPARQIVQKGSICVDGVSLTVTNVGENFFEVSIIPHTLENTTLKSLKIGDIVNIETDMLGKYVEKFLSLNDNKSNITEEFLKEHGF
jgi:riboflavin synthase